MRKISVVIPAYNEERNLKKRVLDEVSDYLEKSKLDYEVIIVDDGSTDLTKDIVKKYISKNAHFKLIENTHGVKAIAVMSVIGTAAAIILERSSLTCSTSGISSSPGTLFIAVY